MCMRNFILTVGEKIFHFLVVLGFIAGAVSAVFTGLNSLASDGHRAEAYLNGLVQLLLSWSGTLIIALIVYALLDLCHAHRACVKHDLCHSNNNCETNNDVKCNANSEAKCDITK